MRFFAKAILPLLFAPLAAANWRLTIFSHDGDYAAHGEDKYPRCHNYHHDLPMITDMYTEGQFAFYLNKDCLGPSKLVMLNAEQRQPLFEELEGTIESYLTF
ncbi:hypothetical protein EKO04_005999 [Ascochyta lentis]|uniref:Uncharacterized protein n=1 Tax=Ascochyta lentis TaxID=205686 RepID=A0A8H7MGY4_9PLEO|nr:hypothetical protein EKO04_005999 [Ascochyta lentis]